MAVLPLRRGVVSGASFGIFGLVTRFLSSNLQNGLGVQYSIVIQSFGFTTLQTTLLNIPSGIAVSLTSAEM
jgi:hypothetical protein